jgi:hypothetical protein
MSGDTNVQGEVVKKLDVLSNDMFINMIKVGSASLYQLLTLIVVTILVVLHNVLACFGGK